MTSDSSASARTLVPTGMQVMTSPLTDAGDSIGLFTELCRQIVKMRSPAFLTAVVFIALALRFAVALIFISNIPGHTIGYDNFGLESWEMGWTARSLYLGHGFSSPFQPMTGPTALVPPLYPYILSLVFKMFGFGTIAVGVAVLSFNSLCSALTILPLFSLSKCAFGDKYAKLTVLLWTVYPFAIYFSAGRVWDYAVTQMLFTLSLWLGQTLHSSSPSRWIAFGTLYGFTVLSNPSVAMILAILIAASILRTAAPFALAKAGLALVSFALVCAPWSVRNYQVLHSNFFIRDGFWLEFNAGNNGDTTASNSSFAHPASNPEEMAKYKAEGEIRYMAQKRATSIEFVRSHPYFFALASLRRVVRFWTGFWSFRPSYLRFEPFDLPNVPFCSALLILTLYGLRQAWSINRPEATILTLTVAVFPIPYYLTHSSMDYRQPIEPIIVLLIALGIGNLRDRSNANQTSRSSFTPNPERVNHA